MRLAGNSRLQAKLILGCCAVVLALLVWIAPDARDELTFNCRICGAQRGETRYKLNGITFWTTRMPPTPPVEAYIRVLKRPHTHEWAGGVAYFYDRYGNHGDGVHTTPGMPMMQPEYTRWALENLAELPVSSESVAWQFHQFVIDCERRGGFQRVINVYVEKRPRSIDDYLALLVADTPLKSNP